MNYHHRFIKDYAHITHPLHELTKDVPFIWEEAQQGAFELLKKALVMSPVLALPKDTGRFWLEMDTQMWPQEWYFLRSRKMGPTDHSDTCLNHLQQWSNSI
jgi:hypothetical protein